MRLTEITRDAGECDRREVISRLVEDRWESEDEFDVFFAGVTAPEELHLFAYHLNMDTGAGELRKVVEHPLCDRGTLLLIYWRLSPGYFHSDELVEGRYPTGSDQHRLFTELERRYLSASWASEVLRFDPRQFRGRDLVALNGQYGGLPRVPLALFEPTPGEPVRPLWGG